MPVIADARLLFDNNTNYMELTNFGLSGTGVVPGNLLNVLVSSILALPPNGKINLEQFPKNYSATTEPIDAGPTGYLCGLISQLMRSANQTALAEEYSNKSRQLEIARKNPTDWMEVLTYPQGRGFNLYIKLHNQAGTTIKQDGLLHIVIKNEAHTFKWEKFYQIKTTDFVDTTAGDTILSLGRISYNEIKPGLGDITSTKTTILDVMAYFTTRSFYELEDKTFETVLN